MSFPSVETLIGGRISEIIVKSGTVDLWSCSLEASAAALVSCRNWLSAEERARAGRFVRPEDRTGFVLAHAGLRFVLARYVGADPGALRFCNSPTGKPTLACQHGRDSDLRFNLSHSHGRMLIAVGRSRDVGIDLEEVRDRVDPLQLAERFYTLAEYDRIKRRPVSDQALEFYRYWVAKEAVLKGQGIGILSLQQCEIVTSPRATRAGVRVAAGSAVQSGWAVQWLSCGPGWQGAVSAFGDDWAVRVLDAGA